MADRPTSPPVSVSGDALLMWFGAFSEEHRDPTTPPPPDLRDGFLAVPDDGKRHTTL